VIECLRNLCALKARPCWELQSHSFLRLRVHSGTARFNAGAYTWSMQLESIKAVFAMLWVSAVCMAGIAGNVNSTSSWTVLTAVAVLPPLVMMRLWNDPRQTISQSIQQVLR
jgi:hypothetical protein